MSKIQIGLLGSTGRMGEQVISLLTKEYAEQAQIKAKPKRNESLDPLFECDVIIDFSLPEALDQFLDASHSKNCPPLVSGTTGLSTAIKGKLENYAKNAPVLHAHNFSTGVHAFLQVVKQSAPLFSKLGYLPRIVETHHTQKKDAPSGTAMTIKEVMKSGFKDEVPAESLREGDVVGIHTVVYLGDLDGISLTHHAKERSIFAKGAIDTALWLSKKNLTSGMVTMEDYFNELS